MKPINTSNAFKVLADDDLSQAAIGEALEGWAHNVKRTSDRKQPKKTWWHLDTAEDVNKFVEMFSKAKKAPSPKTLYVPA